MKRNVWNYGLQIDVEMINTNMSNVILQLIFLSSRSRVNHLKFCISIGVIKR